MTSSVLPAVLPLPEQWGYNPAMAVMHWWEIHQDTSALNVRQQQATQSLENYWDRGTWLRLIQSLNMSSARDSMLACKGISMEQPMSTGKSGALSRLFPSAPCSSLHPFISSRYARPPRTERHLLLELQPCQERTAHLTFLLAGRVLNIFTGHENLFRNSVNIQAGFSAPRSGVVEPLVTTVTGELRTPTPRYLTA